MRRGRKGGREALDRLEKGEDSGSDPFIEFRPTGTRADI